MKMLKKQKKNRQKTTKNERKKQAGKISCLNICMAETQSVNSYKDLLQKYYKNITKI